jgi:hypothetical protein
VSCQTLASTKMSFNSLGPHAAANNGTSCSFIVDLHKLGICLRLRPGLNEVGSKGILPATDEATG